MSLLVIRGLEECVALPHQLLAAAEDRRGRKAVLADPSLDRLPRPLAFLPADRRVPGRDSTREEEGGKGPVGGDERISSLRESDPAGFRRRLREGLALDH